MRYVVFFEQISPKTPVISTQIITVPDQTSVEDYQDPNYVAVEQYVIKTSSRMGGRTHETDHTAGNMVMDFVYGNKGKNATPKQKLEIVMLYAHLHPLMAREYRAIVSIRINKGNAAVRQHPEYLLPLLGVIQGSPTIADFLMEQKRIEIPESLLSYAKNTYTLLYMLPKSKDLEFNDEFYFNSQDIHAIYSTPAGETTMKMHTEYLKKED